MKRNRKEKKGDKFGKLTIIDFSDFNKRYAICSCECGKTKIVETNYLAIGRIKSCGCLRRIIERDRNYNPVLYGEAINKELRPTCTAWASMLKRCLNKTNADYKYYGGRNITVCDRWLNFYNFYEDMGKKPKGTILDRIDPNKNYEPYNCRWATRKQQLYNKTNSILLEYKGKKWGLQELAKKYGINRMTLKSRIFDMQWPIEKAIKTPIKKKTHTKQYKVFYKNKIIPLEKLATLTSLQEKELFDLIFKQKQDIDTIIKNNPKNIQ